MSLRVAPGPLSLRVMNDLIIVADEPGLQIDAAGDVTIAGGQTRPGQWGSRAVHLLIEASCDVVIHGTRPETVVVQLPRGPITLGMKGGGFVLPDRYPGALIVEVFYDATFCDGRGYTFPDIYGAQQPGRPDITLFHELVHAYQICEELVAPNDLAAYENGALAAENEYRVQTGAPIRANLTGAGPCVTPPPAPPPAAGGGARVECFVATAAYGSPDAAQVQQLRAFRDEVLRPTRGGYDFFERFYAQYYRLSPEIVQAMNADPELRRAVRVAIVAPLVRYLRLATRFPDAGFDDLPPPWRRFAEEVQGDLSTWAGQLPIPERFDDLPLEAALDELKVILRFFLRSGEDRAAFVRRLQAAGQLPLRADPARLSALRERFGGVRGVAVEQVLVAEEVV